MKFRIRQFGHYAKEDYTDLEGVELIPHNSITILSVRYVLNEKLIVLTVDKAFVIKKDVIMAKRYKVEDKVESKLHEELSCYDSDEQRDINGHTL